MDFINVWYEDPNTPIDDLKLPPSLSHMVATFINEAKWKEQQAKQAKVAKLKKEKFLKQNLLNLTPQALVSTQAELKTMSDKYTRLSDRQSLKVNFIKFATDAVDEYNKKVAPPMQQKLPESSYTVQLPEEDEADEPVAEEITQETPADEYAPAEENVPIEENASAEETARTETAPAPEERIPSPQPSKAKRPKVTQTESSTAPLDATPLNVATSYSLVPFRIDYVIPEEDEEMEDAESEEIMDEEIQIDDIPQSTIPQKTSDDIDCTTPAFRDDFWVATEILTGSDGKTVSDESALGSAASADDFASSTKKIPQAEEYPQPEEKGQNEENAPSPNSETAIVVVNTETAMIVAPLQEQQHNLQPQQNQPFSRRPKFQKEAFYEERMYFTGANPYDKLRIRHRKFWTRTHLNYYASVLCGRNKIFQQKHIPHVDMEEIPCFTPVLNVLHEAGLLTLCTDIGDWNNDIILQFYATLHISGDPKDVNTWVLDWMTQHTHYKAPATELLRALPISIPSENVVLMYDELSCPTD
ncbi:hypothetical protein ZWY2020_034216 [Hordeum vulgare]|nr:hypothetical protein ZWY2020_034216 [Hordeum vulgare]